MNILKKNTILIIVVISVIFSACQPMTIERQVEKLMKTDDSEKRTEIAYALADSLQIRCVELVAGFKQDDYSKEYIVIKALEDMLFRYKQIANEPNEAAKAYECVSYIPLEEAVEYLGLKSVSSNEPNMAFNLIKAMSNDKKETALITGINVDNANEEMQDLLIAELKNMYGEEAMQKFISLWADNMESECLKKAVASYGNQAINYLIRDIENYSSQELLARLGKSALAPLQKKMKSSDENEWTAAANTIVKMGKYHPEITSFLYNAVGNSDLSIVAKNYRFYIKAGIRGSEKVMIRALDNYFSKDMCLDYINCGYGYLEELASDVANSHGYQVYSSEGKHYGPRWGEGN
jgi:HEAT repeat protein